MNVGERLQRVVVRLIEPAWIDAAAAVAITALAQFELRATDAELGPALALLAQTLAIAWRRTATLPAVMVAVVALAVEGLLLNPTSTLGGLIAGLVLTYSAARYVPASQLLIAAVAIAGGVGVHRAATPGSGPLDVAFDVFFLAAAWGMGRVLDRRQDQTDQLRREWDSLAGVADQRAAEAVVEERARIARELHDVVAHSLSIIAVQAAAAEQVVGADPTRARQAIAAVRDVSQQALVEMRRLVGLMRSAAADESDHVAAPQPRLDQVDTLVGQLCEAGLPVSLQRSGEVRPLPHGVELCAFRVVQEALTNVLKHAGRVQTTVTLDYGPDQLRLRVEDAGAGARMETVVGHGLVGMRERVALYGGHLAHGQGVAGGFVVEAHLPCPSTVPEGR